MGVATSSFPFSQFISVKDNKFLTVTLVPGNKASIYRVNDTVSRDIERLDITKVCMTVTQEASPSCKFLIRQRFIKPETITNLWRVLTLMQPPVPLKTGEIGKRYLGICKPKQEA